MRRFVLERREDETGVSGTGQVLEGVVLKSGRVVTEWRPPLRSIGVYDDFEQFERIHVHPHKGPGPKTSKNRIIWIDPRRT